MVGAQPTQAHSSAHPVHFDDRIGAPSAPDRRPKGPG